MLNCDSQKLLDFFLCNQQQLKEKERKDSNVDSEQGLSQTQEDEVAKALKTESLNNTEENEEKKTEEEENKPEESNEEKEKGNFNFFKTKDENVFQKIEVKEEDSQKIELLDYLLNFLETDQTLNHVLAGYFSKFLILLLNRSQKTVN